jgi:hypothetical protein
MAHRENNDLTEEIKIIRSSKFRDVISQLFPTDTRRRGIENEFPLNDRDCKEYAAFGVRLQAEVRSFYTRTEFATPDSMSRDARTDSRIYPIAIATAGFTTARKLLKAGDAKTRCKPSINVSLA